MGKLRSLLLNITQFLSGYSITTLLPQEFPIPYQILPETREFKLYEMVWWNSEKWCIRSIHCTYYRDCRVWKLELERHPCKYSSHNIQYVDSREVKKIIRCGGLDVQSWRCSDVSQDTG